jgi:membrane-bound lytic murein transglycosylase D
MTIMYKNAAAYDLYVEPDPTWEYDNVVMDADTGLALIAAAVDRPVGQLKQLNPALLQTVAPKGYALHLPAGSADALKAALDVVPLPQRKSARIHLVQDDDTLATLAKKYGTTAAKLTATNNGSLPSVGKFALIPPVVVAKSPAKPATKKTSQTSAKKPTSRTKATAKTKPSTKPTARAGEKAKPAARTGA